MSGTWCVYQHTNTKNGKAYVGITCQKTGKRWNNGKGYLQNKKFSQEINEYGWDSFSHSIIADGLSKSDALSLEKKMIANLSLVENGYNNRVCGGSGAKLSLNKEAQLIRSGFRRSSLPWFDDIAELFDKAEAEGAGSNLCDNINIHCEHIVQIMTKNGNPPGYCDQLWLSQFWYLLSENVKAVGEFERRSLNGTEKTAAY